MMFDPVNPVRTIEGVVQVSDDDGKILATFTGHNLEAWREFQLNAVKRFGIVVPDAFMPSEIGGTITAPYRCDDKNVPSGG